jgi:hypothetical protein
VGLCLVQLAMVGGGCEQARYSIIVVDEEQIEAGRGSSCRLSSSEDIGGMLLSVCNVSTDFRCWRIKMICIWGDRSVKWMWTLPR